MMHWRARRLLPAIYDGTLPELVELDVHVHALGCARCRRALREFEIAETLLLRMPVSLLPLEWSPTAYSRLASLSRWSLVVMMLLFVTAAAAITRTRRRGISPST